MSDREALLRGLVSWCEDQKDSLHRQIEMMESGYMHIGTSRGGPIIDETPNQIDRCKRNVAELQDLLHKIREKAI